MMYGSWLESVSLKLYRMESPSGFLDLIVAVVSTCPYSSVSFSNRLAQPVACVYDDLPEPYVLQNEYDPTWLSRNLPCPLHSIYLFVSTDFIVCMLPT
jgi:hypothetical protein